MQLRRIAAERGLGASEMIRSWVAEAARSGRRLKPERPARFRLSLTPSADRDIRRLAHARGLTVSGMVREWLSMELLREKQIIYELIGEEDD